MRLCAGAGTCVVVCVRVADMDDTALATGALLGMSAELSCNESAAPRSVSCACACGERGCAVCVAGM